MKITQKKFNKIQKIVEEELLSLLSEQESEQKAIESKAEAAEALLAKLEKMQFVSVLKNKKHTQAELVKFLESGTPGWDPSTKSERTLLNQAGELEDFMPNRYLWRDQRNRINKIAGTNFKYHSEAMQNIAYGVDSDYVDGMGPVDREKYKAMKKMSFEQLMNSKKADLANDKQNVEATKQRKQAELDFYKKVFGIVREESYFKQIRSKVNANLLKNYKKLFGAEYRQPKRVMVSPSNNFKHLGKLLKNLGISKNNYNVLYDLSLMLVSCPRGDRLLFHTPGLKNFVVSLVSQDNSVIVSKPVTCKEVAMAASPDGNKILYLAAEADKLRLWDNDSIKAEKSQAIEKLRSQPAFAKWAAKSYDKQDLSGEEDEYDRGIRAKAVSSSSNDFYAGSLDHILLDSRWTPDQTTRYGRKDVVEVERALKALQYEYDLWTRKRSIPGARLIDWRGGLIIDQGYLPGEAAPEASKPDSVGGRSTGSSKVTKKRKSMFPPPPRAVPPSGDAPAPAKATKAPAIAADPADAPAKAAPPANVPKKKNKNVKYDINKLYPNHNKEVAKAVKELQRYLGFSENDIDGIFGSNTTAAVRKKYYKTG